MVMTRVSIYRDETQNSVLSLLYNILKIESTYCILYSCMLICFVIFSNPYHRKFLQHEIELQMSFYHILTFVKLFQNLLLSIQYFTSMFFLDFRTILAVRLASASASNLNFDTLIFWIRYNYIGNKFYSPFACAIQL